MIDKRTAVVKAARKSMDEQNLSQMSENRRATSKKRKQISNKQHEQKQRMDKIIFSSAINSAIKKQNHEK